MSSSLRTIPFVTVGLIATELGAQHEWRQIALPEARTLASMQTDPATGELVLFGGVGDGSLADSWRRAGTAWTRHPSTFGPSARYGPRMTADLARNQVLLFGGYTGAFVNDTWVLNRQGWSQLFPAQSPGGRYAHGFAWDAARGRAVVYGGWANGYYSDTWEWDGSNWIQRLQSSAPGGRYWHAMVYDPSCGATLVFGGYNGAGMQDTWLWDGQTWSQPTPPARPPARWAHAMAHDPVRQRVVMFGGSNHNGTLDLGDTWEWDCGTRSWTQMASNGPAPRSGHVMAFDPVRGRVMLFGGELRPSPTTKLSDLWEWSGSAWTQVEGSMPSPRYGSAFAYDEAADLGLLFGGIDNRASERMRDDTWLWNGTAWSPAAPTQSPPSRGYHALAYDPLRGNSVLFGGLANGSNRGDTWLWSNGGWTQAQPATAPTARHGHAIAFHAGVGELFLFGGHDGAARNDLWSWNGTNWISRTPSSGNPPVRWLHSLAFDPDLNRLVLFGGWSGGGYYGDTWAFDVVTGWTLLSPPLSPPTRRSAQMVFDPSRGAVVLFGGRNAGELSDTWELRGSSWTKCTQFSEPPARQLHAMAYDSHRARLLSFGGYSISGGDLWECFNPNPASFALLPAPGCAMGTSGVPVLGPDAGSLPWRGEDFRLALHGLPTSGFVSGAMLMSLPPTSNVSLGFAGFPQCFVYAFPTLVSIPMSSAGPGRAIASLPIPPLAAAVGLQLVFQGAALMPFPLQLGMSPAGVGIVGARH